MAPGDPTQPSPRRDAPGITGTPLVTTSRLAGLEPRGLTAAQRAIYDAIVGGRRAEGPQLFRLTDDRGRLEGPFNAFLLQPRIGGPLQALGAALRYDGTLTDREREIAILLVAAHHDSAFEWASHAAVGRHAGLTDAEITQLSGPDPTAFRGVEHAVVTTTRLLLTDGDLDDDAYDEAIGSLGEAGLFELGTLVSYYAGLALQLRIFRVDAARRPGRTES